LNCHRCKPGHTRDDRNACVRTVPWTGCDAAQKGDQNAVEQQPRPKRGSLVRSSRLANSGDNGTSNENRAANMYDSHCRITVNDVCGQHDQVAGSWL